MSILPKSPTKTTNSVHIARQHVSLFCLFLLLSASGCCFGMNDKPGVVLRGDWAVELNRAKAIKTSDKTYEKKAVHKYPCGRFGCLRCALGPNGDDDKENVDENDADTDTENCSPNKRTPSTQTTLTPPYPGMYPVPQLPPQANVFLPYNHPMYAGVSTPYPGQVPQFSQPIPPVQVINPANGQRIVMQPALPGQPGVPMINAISGQAIMVNPNPSPVPMPIQAMQVMPQLQPMQQFAPMPQAQPLPPLPPLATQMYGNTQGIDPNTFAQMSQMAANQMAANQMMMNSGVVGYPPPISGADTEKTPTKNSDSKKEDKARSQMPYPKYHSAPTEPVFSRTNGIAKQSEIDEEDRIRNLQLEKVLGTKVPENAKISSNGINQQIQQAGSASVKGGVPAPGSPFSQLGGALGLSETSSSTSSTDGKRLTKIKTTSTQSGDAATPSSVEQQLKIQQLQINEMKKQLEKAEQARQTEQKLKQEEQKLRLLHELQTAQQLSKKNSKDKTKAAQTRTANVTRQTQQEEQTQLPNLDNTEASEQKQIILVSRTSLSEGNRKPDIAPPNIAHVEVVPVEKKHEPKKIITTDNTEDEDDSENTSDAHVSNDEWENKTANTTQLTANTAQLTVPQPTLPQPSKTQTPLPQANKAQLVIGNAVSSLNKLACPPMPPHRNPVSQQQRCPTTQGAQHSSTKPPQNSQIRFAGT